MLTLTVCPHVSLFLWRDRHVAFLTPASAHIRPVRFWGQAWISFSGEQLGITRAFPQSLNNLESPSSGRCEKLKWKLSHKGLLLLEMMLCTVFLSCCWNYKNNQVFSFFLHKCVLESGTKITYSFYPLSLIAKCWFSPWNPGCEGDCGRLKLISDWRCLPFAFLLPENLFPSGAARPHCSPGGLQLPPFLAKAEGHALNWTLRNGPDPFLKWNAYFFFCCAVEGIISIQ